MLYLILPSEFGFIIYMIDFLFCFWYTSIIKLNIIQNETLRYISDTQV